MYKLVSWIDICTQKIEKDELAKIIGLSDTTFDYALPQHWLDTFVDKHDIPYHNVLSTTFWVYDNGSFSGRPVSGCIEINELIEGDMI